MAVKRSRIKVEEPTTLEVIECLESELKCLEDSNKFSDGRIHDVDVLWDRECLRKAIQIVKAS